MSAEPVSPAPAVVVGGCRCRSTTEEEEGWAARSSSRHGRSLVRVRGSPPWVEAALRLPCSEPTARRFLRRAPRHEDLHRTAWRQGRPLEPRTCAYRLGMVGSGRFPGTPRHCCRAPGGSVCLRGRLLPVLPVGSREVGGASRRRCSRRGGATKGGLRLRCKSSCLPFCPALEATGRTLRPPSFVQRFACMISNQ